MKKIICMILTVVMLMSVVSVFAACGKSQNIKVIDIALTEEKYAFAVKKGDADLLASINAFLDEITKNGKFAEILDKYFGDGTPSKVTSATKDPSKDQLVVATNAAFAPFEYKEGEYYYGIDMEIMDLYAKSVNKELVIDNMDFDAVCTSVGQGLCDVAAAGLTINETRQKILDFSDSYYNASQMIIVMEDDKRFDECKTVEDVEKILKGYDEKTVVGVQGGTTGQFYAQGDADWGFDGFPFKTQTYNNGALAVQAMKNGSIDFVIIDEAPAKRIVDTMNK